VVGDRRGRGAYSAPVYRVVTMNLPLPIALQHICEQYAPYYTMKEFGDGLRDYLADLNYSGLHDGVGGQAYDRGAEAAMKYRRALTR
jgi:hypothetical protein